MAGLVTPEGRTNYDIGQRIARLERTLLHPMVRRLRRDGFTLAQIAERTELPLREVKAILKGGA